MASKVITGRAPQPLSCIRKVINPFSESVWILLVISTASVIVTLILINIVEKVKLQSCSLCWYNIKCMYTRVFLFPKCTYTILQGELRFSDSAMLTLSILLVEHKLSYLKNIISPTLVMKTIWLWGCFFLSLAYQVMENNSSQRRRKHKSFVITEWLKGSSDL